LLALVAGLMAMTLWRQRPRRVEPPAEDAEAVWYQLPPDDGPQ
jgi:hypothetical protein